MDLFDEKIDELLAKHLAGECSPEEEQAVGQWLAESPTHRKYLDDLQWLWQRSPGGRTPPPRAVDTEAALQQVRQRVQFAPKPLRWQRGFWLQAAAVFLLAAAAVYWWQSSLPTAPVQIVAAGSALTDTLGDGSVVTLERASGLTLTAGFNRQERRVRLQGEAYFKVAHNTAKPFVVEVQELNVKVVGTAFYVDNVSDPNLVTVQVTEGRVLVSSQSQALLLTPGEQATYDRQRRTLTRSLVLPEQGNPASRSRLFRFNATPLDAVLRQVSTAYGVPISLKNKALEKCQLTARYNNLSLDRVLELIVESFSLTLEKTPAGYVLDGAGCGE